MNFELYADSFIYELDETYSQKILILLYKYLFEGVDTQNIDIDIFDSDIVKRNEHITSKILYSLRLGESHKGIFQRMTINKAIDILQRSEHEQTHIDKIVDILLQYSKLIKQYPLQVDSWTILNDFTATKTIDKSVLLYKSSGIPQEIRSFFEMEKMNIGEQRVIAVIYNDNKYAVTIEREMIGRTRMRWRADLSDIFIRFFKRAYEEIEANSSLREDIRDKIRFHKIDAGTYKLRLES